jgi:F0F1-type ATP synthase gamma subunit
MGLAACAPAHRSLFVIGDQGRRILEEQGTAYIPIPRGSDFLDPAGLVTARDEIAKRYLKEELGQVLLVYPKYFSISRQEVVAEWILPFQASWTAPIRLGRELVLESPIHRIEQGVVFWWVRANLTSVSWHAKLSELAARAVHLEGASDELNKQNRDLTLKYFRAFHEEMDRSVREIYASLLTARR